MIDPTTDPAFSILDGDPALTDEHRAALFDVFHDSKNPAELAEKLQPLVVPDDTKRMLLDAKVKSTPAPAPVDKTIDAMTKIKAIPPDVLDLIETHPNTLKALVAAASTPEKGATEAAGEGKSGGKGKGQAGAKDAAPLAQPPRPDGLEHLPPIPDGHRRVLASDGGIHDIPDENVEQARFHDPRLHVLNP